MNPYGPQVVPPGGTLTYERDGIKITATSRLDLIRNFTDSLIANGKSAEGIENEIDRHLAGQSFGAPILASSIAEKPRTTPKLIERVNSWLMNKFSQHGTLKFVSSEEARRRSAVCIQCKENQKWQCAGCGRESNEKVERNVFVLSQGRKNPFSKRLHACSISGQENKLAVHLESNFLLHRKSYIEKLPNQCWLKLL